MRMLRALCTAGMIAACADAEAQGSQLPQDPTAQDLLIVIEREGTEAAFHYLHDVWMEYPNTDERFMRVLSRIASGQRSWLLVARKLLDVSDPDSSSKLTEAIAQAMPRNPEDTLLFFGDESGSFCQNLTRLTPTEDAFVYLRRVERALLAVKRPALPWRNDACLSQLQVQLKAAGVTR